MSQKTPFTIYASDTGQVLCAGTAADPANLPAPGESLLVGARHPDGWIDVNGLHHTKPERPSPHHAWDWTAKAWQDHRTLQDLRDAKWDEVRTTRDALESTSFPYMGRQIQSDIVSVLRIDTAVRAADYAASVGAPFSTQWRCADNTLLALDGPAMQMMPVALAAYSQALHNQANTLRAQIAEASTPEAVAAIVWPSN